MESKQRKPRKDIGREKYVWGDIGDLQLNITKLTFENKPILRYKTKHHTSLKTQQQYSNELSVVSDDLKNILLDIVNENKFSSSILKYLPIIEKKFLYELIKVSKLFHKLNINADLIYNPKEDLNRFELLKGQIEAGNDNPEIKDEFFKLLLTFIKEGKVSLDDGIMILIALRR